MRAPAANTAFLLSAAPSLDCAMPLANGEADEDSAGMHVDSEGAALTGGGAEVPAGAELRESGSVAPKEMEIYTVSAMQTPCRCRSQYACYF